MDWFIDNYVPCDPFSTCNLDKVEHICHSSQPMLDTGGALTASHNPPSGATDPSLLDLVHDDPVSTWDLPTTCHRLPSHTVNPLHFDFMHPNLAPSKHMPNGDDFRFRTFPEHNNHINPPFLFANQPSLLIGSNGILDAQWFMCNTDQSTFTTGEPEGLPADATALQGVRDCESSLPLAHDTPSLSSTPSSTTTDSRGASRFHCHFPDCESLFQSTKDLARHEFTHNKELFDIGPRNSIPLNTHQCICGRRNPRSDNHKRHVKGCRMKKRLEYAMDSYYHCRCGRLHSTVQDHMWHVEDPIDGCGRRLGRRPKTRS